MLHPCRPAVIGMAAGFEDVVKAGQVAFDIGVRVGDGIAHPCLCGEVDDDIRAGLGEKLPDQCPVGNRPPDKLPSAVSRTGCLAGNLRQPVFLEGDVIIGV